MGGTSSSSSIIGDVYKAMETLEIVYRENGDAVEGIVDRNGNIIKELGER